MKNKKKNGFTLIELVIVISILLLLVAIAIPKFSKSNLSAQVATHNLNCKEIRNAALMYLIENPEIKNTSLGENELGAYFENGYPKPAKGLSKNSFTVSVSDEGNITVSPGEISIVDNALVENDK